MEKVVRILLGFAIAAGAIWFAFKEKEKPSAYTPKVVGGYEVSEQTEKDPLAIPIPQIVQTPPKELPTETQKQIQQCLSQSTHPFDKKAVTSVKSLETLRGLLTTKEAPSARERTREAITFQTGDQIKDGTKYRALYAPLDNAGGASGWKLFLIGTDGLPDPEKLPESQKEARQYLAELIRKSTVVEHDRDERFVWANGATADIKSQDQRITEIAFKFDNKLLGCSTTEGTITCKCL